VNIAWVKFGGTLICIKGVGRLVVARLVQCAEVVPNLRDIWIETDGTGICIQCIPILVNLVIENSDGAPEGRVSAIAIDRLLVGLIGLGVLLL
jgi:hypothetical protein